MKAAQIYVGINGAKLALTGGNGVAVYPCQKGAKESHILLESGKVVSLKGARINGVGVPRFLQENGFELAQPGDPLAAQLADFLDIRDGTKLVEKASQNKAAALQAKYAGQTCTVVPFDAEKPCVTVDVKAPQGFTTVLFDMGSGFNSGMVQIEYTPGSIFDVALSTGWLVGPDGDAEAMPRCTEYGGLIEHAVYVMCNSGLATLVGAKHLAMDDQATAESAFPRGMLELALETGDCLRVGSDAGDELLVQYVRNGHVIYSRTGMPKPRLAEVIGAIAAVMVRVSELDAMPAKKSAKKAA